MTDTSEPTRPALTPDQHYLLSDQYKDASNLNARIQLHERFTTNPYDWQRWVFDHLKAASGGRILEIGCGPARLWLNNFDRIPRSWQITLSDFSPGMLQEAQHNLQIVRHAFAFQLADAQVLPFKNKSFDVAIANHMLYHVPDRTKALSEIRRILAPKGHFYAATNGQVHLREIHDLIKRVVPGYVSDREFSSTFTLENGTSEIAGWFSHVTVHEMDDGLLITEVEPLIAYILSGPARPVLDEAKVQQLRAIIADEIAAHGAVRVTKSTGLFEAW